MKKYIAPSVEILTINAETVLAVSAFDKVGGTELSNSRIDDMEWDEE